MTLKEAALAGIYRVTHYAWVRNYPQSYYRLHVDVGEAGPALCARVDFYNPPRSGESVFIARDGGDGWMPYAGPLREVVP